MTLVVAEIGANHQNSLALAVELIEAAADAGANAVKFQCYDPEKLCLDHDYVLEDGPWKGRKLIELYYEGRTPYTWMPTLFEKVRQAGMLPFASVFDADSIQMLEDLHCLTYKVASFELVNPDLLKAVAETHKAVVLSTGMATYSEIQAAVGWLRQHGCQDLTLLHCVSTYPAPPEEVRLGNLKAMRDSWSCHIGLSDHTMNNDTAAKAVLMGAIMIEKHFTLNRSDGGLDASFSLEPPEFADLVNVVEGAEKELTRLRREGDLPTGIDALTNFGFGPTDSEAPSLKLRPSLHFTCDLPAGTKIERQHITAARPATRLRPLMANEILGCAVKDAVRRGLPVTLEALQ